MPPTRVIIDLSQPPATRLRTVELTQDEMDQRVLDVEQSEEAARVFRRAERDALLKESEWTTSPLEGELHAEWDAYRQALRDHPLDDSPFPPPPGE